MKFDDQSIKEHVQVGTLVGLALGKMAAQARTRPVEYRGAKPVTLPKTEGFVSLSELWRVVK